MTGVGPHGAGEMGLVGEAEAGREDAQAGLSCRQALQCPAHPGPVAVVGSVTSPARARSRGSGGRARRRAARRAGTGRGRRDDRRRSRRAPRRPARHPWPLTAAPPPPRPGRAGDGLADGRSGKGQHLLGQCVVGVARGGGDQPTVGQLEGGVDIDRGPLRPARVARQLPPEGGGEGHRGALVAPHGVGEGLLVAGQAEVGDVGSTVDGLPATRRRNRCTGSQPAATPIKTTYTAGPGRPLLTQAGSCSRTAAAARPAGDRRRVSGRRASSGPRGPATTGVHPPEAHLPAGIRAADAGITARAGYVR